MGLMFARRRADAKKQIAANKAAAHAKNHKAALAAHQKQLAEQKAAAEKAKAEVPAIKEAEAKASGVVNGAHSSGTK